MAKKKDAKPENDSTKALDLQYGYDEEEEPEDEEEQSDWLKGLVEYIKSRKAQQVQQVADTNEVRA